MNREIPEAEALALTVRGDVPGVLDGAEALALQTCPDCEAGAVEVGHCAVCGEPEVRSCTSCRGTGGDRVLPLANPLVQAHLVGWLGRGERCDAGPCLGTAIDMPDRAGTGRAIGVCGHCIGTGWIRPPFNRYPWLTPEALGGLPDWIRLALIWGSVERVAAGMGPIVNVADVWAEGPHDHGIRSRLSFDRAVCYVQAFPRAFVVKGPARDPYIYRYNWSCDNLPNPGRRDRLGGAQEADAYLMSKDFALIDETPAGRVIRFEVPDA